MRTLLSKAKQEQFLDENWRFKTLHFKWGKSGMHKCTLYDKRDGILGSAGGMGYDKKGSAFGDFITTHFQAELKRLNTKDYYGLTHYNKKTKKRQTRASKHTKTYVDGACGFNCMENIMNKIGFQLEFVKEDNWNCYYVVNPLPRKHSSRSRLK